MALLVWDSPGERVYETGIDRGVLYLPSGGAVPWNGLTSIVEHADKSFTPIYFDGMKIQDLVALGSYSATMKAYTYPDEFLQLEGIGSYEEAVYLTDQLIKTFGLSYRTKIGNDLDPEKGYKIHIVYNLTAISTDSSFASIGGSDSAVEFQWELTAIPLEVVGFRPTAHFIFDTREISSAFRTMLESILYGDASTSAYLPQISDLFGMIDGGYLIKILDNGDGTWTAISPSDTIISFLDTPHTSFQIDYANALFPNPADLTIFTISDTNTYSDST